MGNTAANVTTGKPAIGGSIYVESAPTSTLPTNATSTPTGFTCVGFISEEGLVNANTFDNTPIKDWGGYTVGNVSSNFADNFRFTMIESKNKDVLDEIYGEENVTGTALSTGISVAVKPITYAKKKWYVDMIMDGNVLKRICLPAAAIIERQEIVYNATDPVAYGVTLGCSPDGSGNTHYEYLQDKPTPTPSP